MRVLVTGGAGYIGSHTVIKLIEAGHDVVIVDSFVNAKRAVLGRLAAIAGVDVPCHSVDLRDERALDAVFAEASVDAVIHFAGLKAVGESVSKPLEYYDNNLVGTLALLRVMDAHGVKTLVFSSSATVYGDKAPVPYVEDYEPLQASNPYGWTKVMIERMLTDLATADDSWRIALLRYFNPVGAHPSGTIGEDPQGIPNNLMPFIAQVAVGRREKLTVFGADYDTDDGTCERDYIHVEDLARGHVVALDAVGSGSAPLATWNMGTGESTSVLEAVKAFERASGRPVPYEVGPRRPGDLPKVWADASKAERELGWVATATLDDMCADAWRWQSSNPEGYPGE